MTASPWDHFTVDELTCNCGCAQGIEKMDSGFMSKLVTLRNTAGFPFPVTSGYRCPFHNQSVSKTGRNGPHTTGHAVDIQIAGEQAFQLIHLAPVMGMTGIGANQKGDWDKRIVHLDDLVGEKRPRIWTY